MTMAQTYESLRIEKDGPIALVTFDRPPVNAMSRKSMLEIAAAFNSFKDDKDTRVAILTAAGERAFMAGVDLNERMDLEHVPDAPAPGMLDSGRIPRECFWAVYDCAVPVVGAINGPALGAGLAVASMCDILIASEKARFGLPEIDVGLLGGGTHLFRLVGSPYKLRRMMFTGQRIDGHEMMRYGAVEAVVPPDQLIPAARALAAEIAMKSPIAVRLAKESLNRTEFMELKEAYRTEQDYTNRLRPFEDSREAAAAWLEKREANFRWR